MPCNSAMRSFCRRAATARRLRATASARRGIRRAWSIDRRRVKGAQRELVEGGQGSLAARRPAARSPKSRHRRHLQVQHQQVGAQVADGGNNPHRSRQPRPPARCRQVAPTCGSAGAGDGFVIDDQHAQAGHRGTGRSSWSAAAPLAQRSAPCRRHRPKARRQPVTRHCSPIPMPSGALVPSGAAGGPVFDPQRQPPAGTDLGADFQIGAAGCGRRHLDGILVSGCRIAPAPARGPRRAAGPRAGQAGPRSAAPSMAR